MVILQEINTLYLLGFTLFSLFLGILVLRFRLYFDIEDSFLIRIIYVLFCTLNLGWALLVLDVMETLGHYLGVGISLFTFIFYMFVFNYPFKKRNKIE